MSAALLAGVLVAGGVFLVAQRGLVRVVIGFVLLGHAANIVLLAAGGLDRRGLPIGDGQPGPSTADPLPQAFVLTAIVITFAVTVYLLALALRGTSPEAHRPGEPATADGDGNTEQLPTGEGTRQQPPPGEAAVDHETTVPSPRPVRAEVLAPKGRRR